MDQPCPKEAEAARRQSEEIEETLQAKDSQIRTLESALQQIRTQYAALQAQVQAQALDSQGLRASQDGLAWRTLRKGLGVVERLLPAQTRRGELFRQLVGRVSPALPASATRPPRPTGRSENEEVDLASLAVLRFPREERPRVSVLIAVFNQWRLTYACLKSLLENTQGISYEVVLVDDASTDATAQALSKVLGITSLRNAANRGFLLSCNHGLQHCRGEHVLFLNNDTQVTPGWLAALLQTLDREPNIGAVGAKLVHRDGRLQEAGSIIWSDGSVKGYGRGADPSAFCFSYQRDVDYCSAACLLVRKDLLDQLGGFDTRYAPGYYEDTDLCLGVRNLGFRIVYQPAAAVVHCESASSSFQEAAHRAGINRRLFVQKWSHLLRRQSLRGDWNVLRARDVRRGKRVLFVDDRVPVADLGSGYPRARSMLRFLAELGYVCTFFPLLAPTGYEADVREFQDLGVEMCVGDYAQMDQFLEERRGLYDLVLISRPHNATRVAQRAKDAFPNAWLIYDAECIYAAREILRHQIAGTPLDRDAQARLLDEEAALMRLADAIIAVSETEKRRIEEFGCGPVHVWGTPVSGQPPELDFDRRADLLFVGGFLTPGSPNEDAAIHFVREVFPLVRRELHCRLTIAGTNKLPAVWALASADVCVAGRVADLRPYYEQARIFIVPTRFAAGVPQKLQDAWGYGLPAVATPLIANQLELAEGDGLLIGDAPEEFAAKIIALYRDRSLWQRLQQRGLEYVQRHCSPAKMKGTLAEIIRVTMGDESALAADDPS